MGKYEIRSARHDKYCYGGVGQEALWQRVYAPPGMIGGEAYQGKEPENQTSMLASRYLTQGVQEPRGRLHPLQVFSPWRCLQ
jgi:hypothetical protein